MILGLGRHRRHTDRAEDYIRRATEAASRLDALVELLEREIRKAEQNG